MHIKMGIKYKILNLKMHDFAVFRKHKMNPLTQVTQVTQVTYVTKVTKVKKLHGQYKLHG